MPASTATFAGFTPAAIQFLVDLAENNDRAWFQPRKSEYERLLKEPLEQLCVALEAELRARDLPLTADPKKSPFRIYRDTRFAKDKSPYKTNVAASFAWVGDRAAPGGDADGSSAGDGGASAGGGGSAGGGASAGRSHTENVHSSGGYFHLQPGEIYVGGGVWHPAPAWLAAFRARVAADFEGFRSIVEAPAFVEAFGSVGDDGESLKRVPAGYPADHPAADILRQRNVTFGRRLADEEALGPALPAILADAFAVGTPLLRYLAAV